MKKSFLGILILLVFISSVSLVGCAKTKQTSTTEDKPITLRISASIPTLHFWVGDYMDVFADQIEKETGNKIQFKRYYGGELVKAGRELDALKGRTIEVAAPFLAPYHEGLFPLSDITQLPLASSDSIIVTKAFQNLLDSKVQLRDGKTFYEYELGSKGLVAWPLGATSEYLLATTGKKFDSVKSFSGVPIRSGSTLGMMALESLGLTPVYMPGTEAYEALSKGTINGISVSVVDWKSFGWQELLRYTITGANMGHWESYIALTKETWDKLPADVQKLWDKTARELALKNAQLWVTSEKERIEEAKQKGSVFVDISSLDPAVQDHVNEAAVATWKKWVSKVEKEGHPAKAAAKLWAEQVLKEGGKLPNGVAEYLGL